MPCLKGGTPALRQAGAHKHQGASDTLQHVVEVVRDASGKLAESLQLLALTQPIVTPLVLQGLSMQGVQGLLQHT